MPCSTDDVGRVTPVPGGTIHPHTIRIDRLASSSAGAVAGSAAIVATIVTAASARADGLDALCALVISAGALAVAELVLQVQAAILILRDGRWAGSLSAIGVATTSPVALYVSIVEPTTGAYLLMATALCTVVHARCLAPRPPAALRQ